MKQHAIVRTKPIKTIFLFSLCAMVLALCIPVNAQQAEKVYRVGYLTTRSEEIENIRFPAFLKGLEELGYTEGRNLDLERRDAPAGQNELLRRFADELVRLKVDVIVVSSGTIVGTVKQTGTRIPIVFAVSANPIGEGLVRSLARPEGNVTGLSDFHGDLIGKRLELLKDIVPSLSRAAFLWNASTAAGPLQLKELQSAAAGLGVTLLSVPVKQASEFGDGFAAMRRERTGALTLHGDAFISNHRGRILEFTVKNRLPAIWTVREHVDSGGLMSYGASHIELWRRTATYVHKILQGAKPADLPVEQPTKFELVINLKTAKHIGLIIPPNVLARADRIIR